MPTGAVTMEREESDIFIALPGLPVPPAAVIHTQVMSLVKPAPFPRAPVHAQVMSLVNDVKTRSEIIKFRSWERKVRWGGTQVGGFRV